MTPQWARCHHSRLAITIAAIVKNFPNTKFIDGLMILMIDPLPLKYLWKIWVNVLHETIKTPKLTIPKYGKYAYLSDILYISYCNFPPVREAHCQRATQSLSITETGGEDRLHFKYQFQKIWKMFNKQLWVLFYFLNDLSVHSDKELTKRCH